MRVPVLALALLMSSLSPALADRDSAIADVRARTGALDVSIDDRGNLWVVVKPIPNIAWDQYAATVCQVVTPHKARVFVANMVDVTSVGRGRKSNEWKVLGRASCAQQ
jgi:hypothetical protein